MLKRTHHCNELRPTHIGQTTTLAGWVNNYRDHGGVVFIDLRDREGITQIVFHPEHREAHDLAAKLRHEDVIAVQGTVVKREAEQNQKLATGAIEINGMKLELLNKAQTPPFQPDEAHKVNEEQRLQYRYIDLRRAKMQNILRTRHRVTSTMRRFLDAQGFFEIETPFLCRSTPEGARDFLVPSRLQHGSFYALPQSPQLFKQILMVAGLDKYFQIVRCFRDEDPRADRQAEFTQLDIEMSFVDVDDVLTTMEGVIRAIWKEVLNIDIPPIMRMPYSEAMDRFGSDRPDMRFGMELADVTDLAGKCDFQVFSGAIAAGGIVKAICVPQGGAKLTRKVVDEMAEWVKQFGVGGLPTTKVEGGLLTTGCAKFLTPVAADLIKRLGAADGDLICFGVSARPNVVHKTLGELRIRVANEMKMIPEGAWKWLWVVDFPLVDWNEGEKRWDSVHHPFTSPHPSQLAELETNTAAIKSRAYDLVLNGSELGGGSIRIHTPEVQQRVFKLLGINEEAAKEKFGFLLDALKFGAPPHGGIAFGVDRIIMHLCGTTNIRDVIAFPKTQNGTDLMTQAPSQVDQAQLNELNLRIAPPPVKA